jgi:hypothetical protein
MGKLELGLLVGPGELKLPALGTIEAELQSSNTLSLSIVRKLSSAKSITQVLVDVLLIDPAVADIFSVLPVLEMLEMTLVCFLGRT